MAKVLLFLVFLIACISTRAQTKSHNAMYYFDEAARMSLVPLGKVDILTMEKCIALYTKAIEIDPGFSTRIETVGVYIMI